MMILVVVLNPRTSVYKVHLKCPKCLELKKKAPNIQDYAWKMRSYDVLGFKLTKNRTNFSKTFYHWDYPFDK